MMTRPILHFPTLLTLKHHKRHQTQQISVTWNLEVLQFLDDSKKDLEMLTVILLLDFSMYLSFMIGKHEQQLHVICN